MRFIIQCSHIAIHSGIYPFIHSFSKYHAQLGFSSGLDAGSTRATGNSHGPHLEHLLVIRTVNQSI